MNILNDKEELYYIIYEIVEIELDKVYMCLDDKRIHSENIARELVNKLTGEETK